MRIGELAARCNCPTETIRYYEKVGLLPPAKRMQNGYRSYEDRHVKCLQFVLRSKELGFSQKEVRRLTDLPQQAQTVCGDVHALLQERVDSVRGKLRELKKLEHSLMRLKDQCQNGTLHECPVIDELMS